MSAQFVLPPGMSPLRGRAHRSENLKREPVRRNFIGLQASLAEMALINRLRARTRRDLSVDTLQRAAQVIDVTARHWFADTRQTPSATE
jgi:hypothetical protein